MPSAYAQTVDDTRDTIQRRTVQFRRLIITVSVVSGVAAGWALLTLSWRPLLTLFALPSLVLVFANRDLRSVHQWRDRLLQAWSEGALRLDAMLQTFKQIPGLPRPTLEGMLNSLPRWPDAALPATARAALHQTQRAAGQAAVEHGLWRQFVVTGGCLLLVIAAATGQPVYLLGLLALAGVWLFAQRRTGARLKALHEHLIGCLGPAKPVDAEMLALVRSINGHGLSRENVARWQALA
ncbi:MAG: hypothetical protein M3Y32_12410 [Pseudomonadota bacterium]|nr:hypothetical protein [Pseudomonadota bacterium]